VIVVAAQTPYMRELEERRIREQARQDARTMPPMTDAQVARVATLLSLAASTRTKAVAS